MFLKADWAALQKHQMCIVQSEMLDDLELLCNSKASGSVLSIAWGEHKHHGTDTVQRKLHPLYLEVPYFAVL